MANEIDILQLDQRTLARYLERGILSQKDYDKYLKQLPDLESEMESIELEHPTNAPAAK